MASTEQIRKWYPDIVTNHHLRGTAGYKPTCDTSKAARVKFPREAGGDYSLLVHPKTVEAWEAYATVMRHYGETVPSDGGTHNCRNIANSAWPSLHAYCTALDLPPNSRKTVAFQTDVLAIRTNSGAGVFRNLAGDRMHDQIDCSPADLASGIDWTTVKGAAMATDHKHQVTSETPPLEWGDAAWAWYVKQGFTTVPKTRIREARREDIAWVVERIYRTAIVPLQKKVGDLEKEVAALKAAGGGTVPPHSHSGTVKVS